MTCLVLCLAGAVVVLVHVVREQHRGLNMVLERNRVLEIDCALAKCEREIDPLLPPRCAVAYDGPTFPNYAGTLCEREPKHLGRHIGETTTDPVATIAWYTAAEKAAQKASAPAGFAPA